MKSILSLVNFKDNRKSGSSCLRRGIRDERSGEIGNIKRNERMKSLQKGKGGKL